MASGNQGIRAEREEKRDKRAVRHEAEAAEPCKKRAGLQHTAQRDDQRIIKKTEADQTCQEVQDRPGL